MIVQADAPGKLVLLGEYAVLDGAPALVAAINRRARVRLHTGQGPDCLVSAPGLLETTIRIQSREMGSWKEQLPLLAEAFRKFPRFTESVIEIVMDTREFFRQSPTGPIKLGLGSSAALTTALLGAITELLSGPESNPPSIAELLRFHRGLQKGRGSGVDLAAALEGGILSYRLDPSSDQPTFDPVDLPAKLFLSFIWTGRPATTGRFLAALAKAQEARPGETRKILEEMAELSSSGLQALQDQRAEDLAEIIDAYSESMEKLGRLIRQPILSEEHRRLRRLARDCGLAYKPSGAGGGDFGMALSRSRDTLAEFESQARALGYAIPKLEIDARGLEFTQSALP